MRWLKHMTNSRRDERVARLLAIQGHVAHSVWWLVLETIAEKMGTADSKCSVTYTASGWAAALCLRPQDVRLRLQQVASEGLLEATWDGPDCTVTVHNLLKYRDEYSRKSGQTPESLRTKSHQTKKQSLEAETDSLSESVLAVESGAKALRMGRPRQTPSLEGKSQHQNRDPSELGALRREVDATGGKQDDPPDKIAMKLLMLAQEQGMNGYQAAAAIERARRKAAKHGGWHPNGAGWLFGVLRSPDARENAS